MPDDDLDVTLRDLLHAGDDESIAELYRCFSQQVCRVASAKISQKLQSRFDEEDILQTAFRTLIRRSQLGEYEFKSDDDLWALMMQIVTNKIRRKARFHHQQKRSVNSEDASEIGDLDAIECSAELLVDEFEELMNSASESERPVIEMRLQGMSNSDIARRLGCTRATSWRILQRVQAKLNQRSENESQ